MSDVSTRTVKYLAEVARTLEVMEKDLPYKSEQIISELVKARDSGKRVYICGNGGSAATASHMASDLNKGANRKDSPRFRAVALTDNIPAMLAWANDSSYDDIFVEQLKNHLEKDDVVIGISGSGNSPNVLKAMHYANDKGALTIGLTGFDGGKMAQLAKICYTVPSNCMQQVEDIHLLIEHLFSLILRDSAECAQAKKG
ncbi:MAG: SIS domain-containing protein [Thermoplasmata archaeon]|jgi:D-sedoheptulose 7-phosphate isomerase|nr:SIS domain-containing protein [Thermoplasmata archaeon]